MTAETDEGNSQMAAGREFQAADADNCQSVQF